MDAATSKSATEGIPHQRTASRPPNDVQRPTDPTIPRWAVVLRERVASISAVLVKREGQLFGEGPRVELYVRNQSTEVAVLGGDSHGAHDMA